eukprot:1741370-Amphidinium_carterae.1
MKFLAATGDAVVVECTSSYGFTQMQLLHGPCGATSLLRQEVGEALRVLWEMDALEQNIIEDLS